MSPDHVIRLRGPWRLSLLHPAGDGQNERVQPCGQFPAPAGLADQLPPGFRGIARLERSFHRPTGLSTQSRLRLAVATNLHGKMWLNDEPLGLLTGELNRFDLSPTLPRRNHICLEVVIDGSTTIDQPICDVRLEIFA
jgi:hypothetical protein